MKDFFEAYETVFPKEDETPEKNESLFDTNDADEQPAPSTPETPNVSRETLDELRAEIAELKKALGNKENGNN